MKGVFLSESLCVNFATNHMATRDGEEKEVQQIIIILEHDAQITGLVIDCADRTITETSNYQHMDLVMNGGERMMRRTFLCCIRLSISTAHSASHLLAISLIQPPEYVLL